MASRQLESLRLVRVTDVGSDIRIIILRHLLLLRLARLLRPLRHRGLAVAQVRQRLLVDVVEVRGLRDLDVHLQLVILHDGAEVLLDNGVLFGAPGDLEEGWGKCRSS